jgi:hypothetical protein
MLAESKANLFETGRAREDQFADLRVLAVGADDPTTFDLVELRDARSPGEGDAKLRGALQQFGMKDGAANAQARAAREPGFDGHFVAGVHEANAAEGNCLIGLESNAEKADRGDGVGQKALATGLVDYGRGVVGDSYAETLLASEDGGGKAGGPAADDEEVWRMSKHT